MKREQQQVHIMDLPQLFLGETDQPRLKARNKQGEWNKHSQVQLITLAFITSYSITTHQFLAPLSLDRFEHLSPVLVSLKLQMHHSQVSSLMHHSQTSGFIVITDASLTSLSAIIVAQLPDFWLHHYHSTTHQFLEVYGCDAHSVLLVSEVDKIILWSVLNSW